MAMSNQRGLVMPLVAISMTSLIAIAGLVMDLGHLYINKTRLQNAADAAALSAAQTLDITHDIDLANAAGSHTFNNAILNQELVDANLTPHFTYSETLQPFVDTTQNPLFVRVTVSGFSQKNFLLPIIRINTSSASATAVAGPSLGLNTVCNAVPLAVCGDNSNNFGLSGITTLTTGADTTGNYRNIDDCNTNDCSEQIAGKYGQCLTIEQNITTTPPTGDFVAQGLNTRFGCPLGSCDTLTGNTDYPADKVTDALSFLDYQNRYIAENFTAVDTQHKELRRVVVMPITDCAVTPAPILGFGCFFLTDVAETDGTIHAEYLQNCQARGKVGVNPILQTGPHTIILYRDFTGNLDS